MLAVGTLWWILLTAVIVIVLLWSVDSCHPVLATIGFIVYLVILQWVSHVPILSTIAEHPSTVVWLVLAYLGIGIVWSFIRWWLYMRQICSGKKPVNYGGTMLAEYKRAWARDHTNDQRRRGERLDTDGRLVVDQNAEKAAWQEELNRIMPKAIDNKGLITIWVIYWPFSAKWTPRNGANRLRHKVDLDTKY